MAASMAPVPEAVRMNRSFSVSKKCFRVLGDLRDELSRTLARDG